MTATSRSPLDGRDELILEQLKDLKDEQRELNARINKLHDRLYELDKKIDERFSYLRCSQIFTASVVGIALAVIYFVFTH